MNRIDKMLMKAKKDGQTRIHVKDLQPKKYAQIIGIDPDVDKSGFCLLTVADRTVDVHEYDIKELCHTLMSHRLLSDPEEKILVVVEGSWCTTHNWHLSLNDNKATATKKGYQVGRNHQTGMIIAQLCEMYGYDVEVHPPLAKKCFGWHGEDGKASHEDLKKFIPDLPHTKQEGRDATLLAWSRADLPLDNNKAKLLEILNSK